MCVVQRVSLQKTQTLIIEFIQATEMQADWRVLPHYHKPFIKRLNLKKQLKINRQAFLWYLIMMYVDNPVFKEILWEWRAFAIKVDPNICRNILDLPLKDGKSTKMLDRYICRLGCDTNIKIRDKDLKIKNLHDKTHEGIERWTTEVYIFSCYIQKHNRFVFYS